MDSKIPLISLLIRKISVNLQYEQTSAIIHIYQLKRLLKMKRLFYIYLSLSSLSLTFTCCVHPNGSQTMHIKNEKEQRERTHEQNTILSFKGIKIGGTTSLDSINSLLLQEPTVKASSILLGDYTLYLEYPSDICNTNSEEGLGFFTTSIVVKDRQSNTHFDIEGTACLYREDSTISKIVFLVDDCKWYEDILQLYMEKYGEPDEEYDEPSGSEFFNNKGVYWDFYNNQRLYINKFEYNGGMRNIYEFDNKAQSEQRVEIIYRDMTPYMRDKRTQAEQQRQEQTQQQKRQEDLSRQKESQDI